MVTIGLTNNTPKGPVTILGQAYVGETLIARPNGVGDADGINHDTATFQWLRNGEPIPDATARTYAVSLSDVGAQLSIRYSYVDFGGTLEILTSDPEPVVPPAGTPIPGDDAPYNPLMILGDATVGQTLMARPNAVTDHNGIDRSTVSFQWLRDGEPIFAATNQAYEVTEADIGAEISVVYTYDDLLGVTKSLISNPKPSVRLPEPVSPPPSDSGDDATDDSLLNGTSGSDTLTATGGLKRISGHESTDTVFFEGNQSHYTLVLQKDGVSVSDHRSFGLGTIDLDEVELIDFGAEISAFSGPLQLEDLSLQLGLDEGELNDIIEIYIAYFNRAPDAIGLNFWASAFAKGTSLDDMALLFADQVETRAAYPEGTSNDDFTTIVYGNVLGREPDQAGLEFWVSALDRGAVSRDHLILSVLEGAKAPLNIALGYEFAQQQLDDRVYLANKVDIGAHFAVHRGMSDVENATAAMALYDGSDASINLAVAAVDAFYDDALDPVSGEFLLQVIGVMDSAFDL